MSNVGSRFAGRHKRASVTRAERQRARALASGTPTPQTPGPFMLAPQAPAFPSDVAVPPHRGAVIDATPADSLSDYTVLPGPKGKPGAKKSGTKGGAKIGNAKGAGSKTTGPAKVPATWPGARQGAVAKSGSKRVVAKAPPARPRPEPEAKPAALTPPTVPASDPPPAQDPGHVATDSGGSPPAPAETATIGAGEVVETRAAAAPGDVLVLDVPATESAAPEPPVAESAVVDAPAVNSAGQPPAGSVEEPAAATAAAPAPIVPAVAVAAPATAEPIGILPPGQRALVKQERSLVARVVAWLSRLAPRKQRASLPKARTRLDRPLPSVAPQPGLTPQVPAAAVSAATADTPATAVGEASTVAAPVSAPVPPEKVLSGRIVLKLSEENARLRRELESLRASVERDEGD